MAPVRTEEHAAPVTKLPNPHTRYAVPPTARTLSGAAAEIPVAGPPAAAAAAAAAAAVAQPAAAPPPATESAFLLAHFTRDIQAVVRAAAVMPAAARRQHREGRAEVRFDYLDGTVQGVALAQSSASRVLDDAALAAVRTARYPATPPQLRGRKLSLVVWVDFHLAAASPG
jgi:protein TonB